MRIRFQVEFTEFSKVKGKGYSYVNELYVMKRVEKEDLHFSLHMEQPSKRWNQLKFHLIPQCLPRSPRFTALATCYL